MFKQGNRQLFDHWTRELVNKQLQNIGGTLFQPPTSIYCGDFNNILISALCYMKRVSSRGVTLTQKSLYKLAIACIFIAQKFYSDFHYDVEDFSISSGITIKDILKLQTITLELLQYNLILTERDYADVMVETKL